MRSTDSGTSPEVCAARPEALVLAVDATTASLIVEEGKKQRCAAQYLVFSETGAALAAQEPSANGRHPLAGVLVTQVVPHPNNNRHPIVAEYQRALAAQNSSGSSYPSVEGYLIVRVLQETLSTCVRDISRTCLLRILRSNTLELPGLRVHFGEDQRQSRPFVEITLLDDQGRFLR